MADDHPFHTSEGWKTVKPKAVPKLFIKGPEISGKLKAGDRIRALSGDYAGVKSIKRHKGKFRVYALLDFYEDDGFLP